MTEKISRGKVVRGIIVGTIGLVVCSALGKAGLDVYGGIKDLSKSLPTQPTKGPQVPQAPGQGPTQGPAMPNGRLVTIEYLIAQQQALQKSGEIVHVDWNQAECTGLGTVGNLQLSTQGGRRTLALSNSLLVRIDHSFIQAEPHTIGVLDGNAPNMSGLIRTASNITAGEPLRTDDGKNPGLRIMRMDGGDQNNIVKKGDLLVCVGIEPGTANIPESLLAGRNDQLRRSTFVPGLALARRLMEENKRG